MTSASDEPNGGGAPTVEAPPAKPEQTERAGEPASQDGQRRPTLPRELPILPVRNAVAFPGTIMPLAVAREKSVALLNKAILGNKLIGVVAQRRPDIDDPRLEDLYRIGTVCEILKLYKMPDGSQNLIVQGIARFGIEELVQTEPFFVARVQYRFDPPPEEKPSLELEALVHNVKQAAFRIIDLTPNVPDEVKSVISNITAPGALADFLASNLSLGVVHKQELLETFDVTDRLKKIHATLIGQLDVLELSEKLHKQVREQIDEAQRRYYLQEQLKAIRKELGEVDATASEIEELRERIAKARMPEAAEKEALRELDRMTKIPPTSPEYSVAADYVRWLTELPWSVSSEENLDIREAERILNEDHYGLEKVKKRILEFLAVRKLKPDGRGPILCFCGPPGVGKTSLGQSIARATGRRFIRMALGGVRDEAELRGHRRTYIGSMPGRIIQEIRKAGTNNPVFMLDEVDKLGADFRGDPSSALLEILDPHQNHSFTDHYLGVPFDLSRVMFIGTANYLEAIPGPLRDRMEIIELPSYAPVEKFHIARQYLVPRQIEENGLTPEQIEFTDDAIRFIIDRYTREAGVRNLERQIGSVARGVAAEIARGDRTQARITRKAVQHYLGPPKYESEVAMRTSVPGVATGLAYTPVGGEILFVEATRIPGKGQLMLTGQLGDVMRESARAAYSLVAAHGRSWGVPAGVLPQSDIHIHVPAGAVPKDGPSAGVAILTALVSLLTGRPCRSDVGMTGEITLRGLVLPIGGVKEKVLAAARAGLKTVILPARNEPDLVDVPAQVRRKLKFVKVTNVNQVLEAALEPPTRKTRRRSTAAGASRRSVPSRSRRRGSTTPRSRSLRTPARRKGSAKPAATRRGGPRR